MAYYGDNVNKLIEQFSQLPGIGSKSAQRLAFYIVNLPPQKVVEFTNTIVEARNNVKYCSVCCNFSDNDICQICSSDKRDKKLVMVVENPRDMASYERLNNFKGVYHILHGLISPMNNVGPDDLKIRQLISRIKKDDIQEIILATNSTSQGEATAMYLANIIKPLGVQVTRIAYGIPIGADIQYADEITLARALDGRRKIT